MIFRTLTKIVKPVRNSNSFCSSSSSELWTSYEQAKAWLRCKKLPPDIDSGGVFCNDRTDLSEVSVYGYDYDYTLASYKKGVEYLIHDIAKQHLVRKYGYPETIAKLVYDPHFPIRGLHFDVTKGLFLKVDSHHQIQLGTVYRGKQRLDDDEVMKIYQNTRLSVNTLETNNTSSSSRNVGMVQLVDIFSKPEMALMAGVMDYFLSHDLQHQPESLHYDVATCIGLAHATFHSEVRSHPEYYLHRDPELVPYLLRLVEAGKQLFVITNSPFETVDKGMSFMVGASWRDLFDVIIVQAGKPHFFTNNGKPFREVDVEKGVSRWDKVRRLEKGRIYSGGTIDQFQSLTGFTGRSVMYFGDHPYADLADVTLHHGWHTGAVIRELEAEIITMNTDEFKWGVNWQQVLMSLIEDNQDATDEASKEVINEWKREVTAVQRSLKAMFNSQFGSTFRSYNNPTYFSRKLFRFSDLYMSRVTNLSRYNLEQSFYPRRGALPHEFKSWFV